MSGDANDSPEAPDEAPDDEESPSYDHLVEPHGRLSESFIWRRHRAFYDEQGVTLDPAKRKDVVWQMQDILNEDLPYIWVAQKKSIAAYSKNWGGLTEPFLMGLTKVPWDTIHQVG